ncbi:MAG: NAD-dependent epimerase/dehydratase family protein [Rhodospirillales bacterium]
MENQVKPQVVVLVVGGAGYIGAVLCGELLRAGRAVRSLDCQLYRNALSVSAWMADPAFEYMGGDMGDAAVWGRALKDVDAVVLLAGLVGDPVTKKFPEAHARINVRAYDTALAALSAGFSGRVVFVSTCSNYGLIPENAVADENWELKPLSLYAKAKVRFEQALLAAKGSAAFTPTVLRFATAFGLSPRMRFDLTVSEFTRLLYLGEELEVFDEHTWRPYCHVLDFADLIGRVLNAPADKVAFEVFNAGGDANNLTKKMIVDEILKTAAPQGRMKGRVRYREGGRDARNYRVDFKKTRETLGFTPKHTVAAGVAELTAALGQGLFHNIDEPPMFHGNYTIDESGLA